MSPEVFLHIFIIEGSRISVRKREIYKVIPNTIKGKKNHPK